MKLEPRVTKIEAELGVGSAQDEIFILPGVRISISKIGGTLVIYRSEIVSAAFVNALLKERFPTTSFAIILPDNHRCPSLCEELGYPTYETMRDTL